jgi:hypothetical protein
VSGGVPGFEMNVDNTSYVGFNPRISRSLLSHRSQIEFGSTEEPLLEGKAVACIHVIGRGKCGGISCEKQPHISVLQHICRQYILEIFLCGTSHTRRV